MESHIKETLEDIAEKFNGYKIKALEGFRAEFFAKEMQKKLQSKIDELFNSNKILFWEEFNNFFQGFWESNLKDFKVSLAEGFELKNPEIELALKELRT